jgi:hypothetical protein
MKENNKLRRAKFVALTAAAIADGTLEALDAYSKMTRDDKWNVIVSEKGHNCTPG